MESMEKDEFGMSNAEKDNLAVLDVEKDEFEIHDVGRDEFETYAAVRTLVEAEKIRADTILMKKVMPVLVKQLRETATTALEARIAIQQERMIENATRARGDK